MTRRREPIAAPPARGFLGRALFYVGLAAAMLLGCCMAVPEATLAMATSVVSTEFQPCASDVDGQSLDAPELHQGDRTPRMVDELPVCEAQTEEEDASSDMHVVASALGVELEPLDHHIHARERELADDREHLLVSTGLGRGPPLG